MHLSTIGIRGAARDYLGPMCILQRSSLDEGVHEQKKKPSTPLSPEVRIRNKCGAGSSGRYSLLCGGVQDTPRWVGASGLHGTG